MKTKTKSLVALMALLLVTVGCVQEDPRAIALEMQIGQG